MVIYIYESIIVFHLILLSRMLSKDYSNKSRLLSYYLYFIAGMFLWIISAFRYGVGTDFFTYYNSINQLDIKNVKNFEYVFYFIKVFSKNIADNGQFFIALIAFLTIFYLCLAIYKLSPYPEMSIMVFLGLGHYFSSFNGIRQYLAISLILYALSLFYSGKKKSSILFLILPVFIHFSSIIFVVFFALITLIKKRKVIYYPFIFLTIFISLLFYLKPNLFYNYIFILGYEVYLETKYIVTGSNIIWVIIEICIFLFYCAFNYHSKSFYNENILYLSIPFSLLSIAFTFLGLQGLIFNRIATYFNIFHIIFIPLTVENIRDTHLRRIVYALILIVSFMGMILFLGRNLSEVVPYQIFLRYL